MEYKKAGSRYVLKLDRGEEIIASITELCKKEKISAGSVTGIGATQFVEAGFYNFRDKKYQSFNFNQGMEILSLLGTISAKDDEPYLHLHICIANEEGEAFGGHLNRAVISVTAEIFIDAIDLAIGRQQDSVTGINLIKFE